MYSKLPSFWSLLYWAPSTVKQLVLQVVHEMSINVETKWGAECFRASTLFWLVRKDQNRGHSQVSRYSCILGIVIIISLLIGVLMNPLLQRKFSLDLVIGYLLSNSFVDSFRASFALEDLSCHNVDVEV